MLYVIDNISNIIDSYNLLIAILIRVSYKKKKTKKQKPKGPKLKHFCVGCPSLFLLKLLLKLGLLEY